MNITTLDERLKLPGITASVGEWITWAAGRWNLRYARDSQERALWRQAREHQVSTLAAQLDPQLNATIRATWAALETARAELAAARYAAEVLPDHPPLAFTELPSWRAEIRAGAHTIAALELKARDLGAEYERAVAAAHAAIDRLIAPQRNAARASMQEIARATEQMNRDARQCVQEIDIVRGELCHIVGRVG